MAQCQQCGAKSQLFLCQNHIDELTEMLTELPRWITYLHEAAVGQTRLGGDMARQTRSDEAPMRFNTKARMALDRIHGTLVRWVQDVTESRGVTYRRPRVVPTAFIGPDRENDVRCDHPSEGALLALWLARHVSAIAADEAAGMCLNEISGCLGDAERVTNRPTPPRFCGPCIHYVEHNRHCGRLLYAPRFRIQAGKQVPVIEVTCPTCKSTHNIKALADYLEKRADSLRFTSSEVLTIMQTLGTPIPERSWRRWRSEGRVKVCGYKRPDNADGTRGSIGTMRRSEADEPVYRLAEVRKVYRGAIRHSDATDEEMSYA